MNTRPPRSTRKDTLFPDTTRFRSLPRHTGSVEDGGHGGPGVAVLGQRLGEGEDKPQPLRLLHLVAAQLVAAPRERCEVARAHATVLRSEEHTSELQSLMRISYAFFCLKKKNISHHQFTYDYA